MHVCMVGLVYMDSYGILVDTWGFPPTPTTVV